MVNGAIVECRAHGVCVSVCVSICIHYMNCTRNQSVLRVIKDHFKPKMVKCEFEQRLEFVSNRWSMVM